MERHHLGMLVVAPERLAAVAGDLKLDEHRLNHLFLLNFSCASDDLGILFVY
jgi:hypothetical protein